MRLRNTSKSGDVDEFKSQSKKFQMGVNKMKHNHGNKSMNDEVMVKVKSSQVAEKEKMTFKTAKKREIWKVVNKMKPNYGNQCHNRVNDEVMAKVKSSQVDEMEKMTVKTAMKKRDTWNSSCGTDIGVFEQICDNVGNKQNPNNVMPSKTHVSARKNIRIETSLGDQIFNEKGPAGIADNSTNIQKDNQVAETQEMDEDEDAGTSKSPAKPKQHLGPSESFATSTQPSEFKSPVNRQHPEGPRRHNTASSLPFAHSGSSASNSSGHIPNGNSSPFPSQRKSNYHPGPSKSLATLKQPPGISETSEVPANCEHPEGPTPVGSTASDSFPTGSSGETTWRIEGRVIRSQGNSAATNEGEEVLGPLHDGAIQCTGQQIKSQGNLTIKFDTGDVTVTDRGRTVQMKMTNGSISGQAEDVTNIVKTLSQVVRDL